MTDQTTPTDDLGVPLGLSQKYDEKKTQLRKAVLDLLTQLTKEWTKNVLPLIEETNELSYQCVKASPEWKGTSGYRYMAYHPTPPDVEDLAETFLYEWLP